MGDGDPTGATKERLAKAEAALQEFCDSGVVTSNGLRYLRRARAALASEPAGLADAEHWLLTFETLLGRARKSDACRDRVNRTVWTYSAAWLGLLAAGWSAWVVWGPESGLARFLTLSALSGGVGRHFGRVDRLPVA